MNIDLIQQYIKADPNILSDILKILDYRNLRTKQAYYAKLAYQYDHESIANMCKEVRNAGAMDRDYWEYVSKSLDKKRRDAHNDALIGFNNIISVGEKNGFEPLYTGPKLSNDEIIKYFKSERREPITNSMFEMMLIIEDNEVNLENDNESFHDRIQNVRTEIRKFNREYSVTKSILKDESKEKDGGIEFDLNALFGSNNVNID